MWKHFRSVSKITLKNRLMSTTRRHSQTQKGTSPRLRETFSYKTICWRDMLTCRKMRSIIQIKLLKSLLLKMNNTMLTCAKNKKLWKSLHASNMNKIIKSRCLSLRLSSWRSDSVKLSPTLRRKKNSYVSRVNRSSKSRVRTSVV